MWITSCHLMNRCLPRLCLKLSNGKTKSGQGSILLTDSIENFDIDFDKVDYDDVLHWYRGWRRSDSDLKEKNRQYDISHERTLQLLESLVKFRAQLLFQESVKDFAIKSQSELSIVHRENKILLKQNDQLDLLNVRVGAAVENCEISSKANADAIVNESRTHYSWNLKRLCLLLYLCPQLLQVGSKECMHACGNSIGNHWVFSDRDQKMRKR